MTKHPSKLRSITQLKTLYGAQSFDSALKEFVMKYKTPTLSQEAVQRALPRYHLPLSKLPVYHKAKLWLGDPDHHRLSSDEYDVIHARPSYRNKRGNLVAARFDPALVNLGQGEYIGTKGELY